MIKNRVCRCLMAGVAILGLTGLALYNFKTNAKFWEASAVNCLTLAIALFVSYHLVQRQNNRRKQKEILLDLIQKLQSQLSQENMYNLTDLSKEELTMRNRSVQNRIHILDGKKKEFGFAEEIAHVQEWFAEYSDLIGNHIEDRDYLENSKSELKRPLDLIDGKLTEMAMKLFN